MATKRTRRTRAELKELMLEAGSEVLLELSPELGFEHLTYGSVFDHLLATREAKVTIGSVHERIWQRQRDFQLDVLQSVVDRVDNEHFAAGSSAVQAVIEGIDLSTRTGRRYALQNGIRVSQNHAWQVGNDFTPEQLIALSLRLRLWALPDDDPEAAPLIQITRRNRQRLVDMYSTLITQMIVPLGFRTRAELGDPEGAIDRMVKAVTAAATGYTVDVFQEANVTQQLPTGPNGELEDWYPIAWTSWALARSTLEFADEGLDAEERVI